MIIVTGIGIVSPYGIGKDAFIEGAKKGTGIDLIKDFNTDSYPVKRGGAVKDFAPKKYIQPMKSRRMSRFSQLALISAIEAWNDSSMRGYYESSEIGVIVGTGLGSVSSTDSFYLGLLERGPQETNPMVFPETVQNIAAAHISMEFGLLGPNTTFSNAEIAGESALFYACELLGNNMANAVLVTGADELTKPLLEGMDALRILSKTGILRPFDIMRDGLLPGEGACTLVLERKDNAERRDAHIYGEIASFGFSSEPVERLYYSSTTSMVEAISKTIGHERPDLIFASANSTKELDYKEAIAIRETLGYAVPVTATTSMTGFFMSAGVMKVGAAMLFIERGFIPPIWGLERPEIELRYVLKPQEQKVRTILVNGFSHGGTNGCILVRGMN
jgi:3-oxoacyl-[acyl-carrier-protein] synthase II